MAVARRGARVVGRAGVRRVTLKRVLIVDLETTGLDPVTEHVLEVAGVLFDLEHAEVVASSSALQHAKSNAAQHVNDIPASLLRSLPEPFLLDPEDKAFGDVSAFQPLYGLAHFADAFVAHRAGFDRSFFPNDLARLLPWICSKFSCDWPKGRWGDHLTNLAIAHGVPVTGAHRAFDDCRLLAEIMKCAWSVWYDDDGHELSHDNHLRFILERGLARGVGEPPRCEHGLDRVEKNAISGESVSLPSQCPNYVRTFLRHDITIRKRCPQHGGSAQWIS